MSVVFDSMRAQFKQPIGCAKVSEKVRLRIRIDKRYGPINAEVVFNEFYSDKVFSVKMDSLTEEGEEIIFESNPVFDSKNMYEYYFSFCDLNGKKYFIKRKNKSFEGDIQEYANGQNWRLTVYEAITTHPNMSKGVMYQIFPDRFAKSGESELAPEERIYRNWGEKPYYQEELIAKDFFGGNLQGITQKLKYLRSLGVTVLYLNPIWLAHSNHRYDPADYKTVDPLLGTEKDLKRFINEAHKSGMIVILDTVLNHTGADSIYFNKNNRYPVIGAFNSKESAFYDWYYFHDYPTAYESWWGFVNHPKINQSSKSFKDFMFGEKGVLDYWYSLGIDGLRLDVPDELPNPTLNLIYDVSKKNRNEPVIIGEVWEDASCKVSYGHRMEYLLGNQLTSVMNYPVRNAILAYIRYGGFWGEDLRETLQTIFIENYPREIAYSLMNFLSTHDTVRAITKLAGPEADEHDREWQNAHDNLTRAEYLLGRKRLIISYLILYFLPGIPSIFYGDEIGMAGQKDPFCRKCYEWNRRDKKLLRVFKNLGKFRMSESEFFKNADFKVIHIDNEICILERSNNERQMFLIINRSDYTVDISQFNNAPDQVKVLFDTGKNEKCTHINPYEGVILEVL